MDFLQKPLAWFSSFYLRVQSKICGRNSFFYSSFLNCSGFWAKNFSDFWPKNVKNLSKLPSTCPEEQFVAWFFFSFESFPILCRNHWHGSQKSIYESRLKIAEKKQFFFVLFSEFFRCLSETFSDFWPNLQKVVKTTFCVSTGTTCGFKIFLKVLNRFGFSAETIGMVLKILYTCPD